MRISIKRVDASLPLPTYHTPGSVAFDLYSRVAMTIPPKSVVKIPTNFIIATPPGYMLAVLARSSTPSRKGLSVPHGIGVIDQDYRGPTDEILLQVYNFTEKDVILERGERIGQAAFIRVDTAEWEEVDTMPKASRGGFGSTGSD